MNSIYVKKGPNRSVKEEYSMAVLNGLDGLNSCFTPYGIYNLDSNGVYSPVVTYSYEGCDSFWDAYYDDLNIVVENKDNMKQTYRHRIDFKKKFISLEDFLCEGSFVGQEWHRTTTLDNPLVKDDKDNSFMDKGVYLALYKYNGILLAFNMQTKKYELISSKYTYDNNYEFSGPIYYELKDEKKIIDDIYYQLGDVKEKRR